MQYQKQQITQQQKLKMNPQLYQSIKLMALPVQELRLRIHEELERNPALELIEEKPEVSLDSQNEERQEEQEYFENSSDPGFTSGGMNDAASDSKRQFMEGALSRPENLHDHLLMQLSLQPIGPDEYEIGKLLINNLDDNGFHIEKPETLTHEAKYPILFNMIDLIRTFDPIGVCTADYRETLIVQTKLTENAPELALQVLEEHFYLLEKGRFDKLAKIMDISLDRVDEIIEFIKTLHPMPGIKYSTESSRYVIPDVVVRIKDGELVIILNDEEIPVLGINSFFSKLQQDKEIKDKSGHKYVQKYVRNKIKDARWFIRSINQRNDTLLKISKTIVEFQRDFFIKGPKFLVPLILKDVADEVGVHETTVSRISNAKYMQTEWGVFEIKHFFSNSISGTGSTGSRFSKEGVKAMIKEILDERTDEKKLSDQKISDELKKRGVNIARRTVAKYRNELDILSSYDR